MTTYTVYILYSHSSDVYYKGVTTDLPKRLYEHQNNLSRYTKNKGPWQLVWTSAFFVKRDALVEELRIKKLNHTSLLKLIENWNSGISVG